MLYFLSNSLFSFAESNTRYLFTPFSSIYPFTREIPKDKGLTLLMIFVTQTSTGTMVKRVPQEQMFVIEATLLENHFLPSSGFPLLMSVEDVLIS